jgi:hypothetical protein
MGDTRAIEKMDHVTTTFFKNGIGLCQLQRAAEALLASLFYLSVDTWAMMVGDGRHVFRGRILCRLEQENQLVLLERLRTSSCGFRVHEGIVNIDFADQESRLAKQESFQQVIQWNGFLEDQLHICLVFGGGVSAKESESKFAPVVQYEISGSPFRKFFR